MNKVAVGVISGIVGAAFGSGVTYLFLNKKYEKQYEEDVADAKEFYYAQMDGYEDKEIASEFDEEEVIVNKGDKVAITDSDYDCQQIVEKLNYNAKYSSSEDAEFVKKENELQAKEDSFSDIWSITIDEYHDENDIEGQNKTKLEYAYLPNDDVLVDSDGKVCVEELELYRHIIDSDINEDDEVFIRDSINNVDAYIFIDERDYSRYVEEEFNG